MAGEERREHYRAKLKWAVLAKVDGWWWVFEIREFDDDFLAGGLKKRCGIMTN